MIMKYLILLFNSFLPLQPPPLHPSSILPSTNFLIFISTSRATALPSLHPPPHPFLHCVQSPPAPPPLPPGSILGNFLLLLNWDGGVDGGKIKGWADERRLGMSANGAAGGFTHLKYAVHPPPPPPPSSSFVSGVKLQMPPFPPHPSSLTLSHSHS